MIYSKTSEYAIRALAYLSHKPAGMPVGVAEIRAKAGVPAAYAAKIFQGLARAGMVGSKSGPSGGYFLKVDPAKLSLLRVIQAMDEPRHSPLFNCVMGRSECSDNKPCCLHTDWMHARDLIVQKLSKETVAQAYEPRAVAYRNQKQAGVLSKRMKRIFGHPSKKVRSK